MIGANRATTIGAVALMVGLAGCASPAERQIAASGACQPVATSGATATLRLGNLQGGARQVCLHTPPHRLFVQEVSIWPGETGGAPRAAISVQRLTPGYHFLLERDLRQQTAHLGVAQGAVNYSSVATARNGIGTMRYLPFDIAGQSCVAFSQYWGGTDMETTVSVGRARVFGYYCDDAPIAAPSSEIAQALTVEPDDPVVPAGAPTATLRSSPASDAFMRVAIQQPRRTGHF